MRTRTRFLAVAAVALFAAQVRAQESLGEPIKGSVSLSEVSSFPEAYKRVPFDLELLFHGPRDLYNPYYTLFEPASYLNFAAWSADQPIWTRDTYVNDYPFFYVDRKNSALEHQMVSMKPFTWFTARCIVRNSAQGRAWIEVLSVTQTAATLDTADLRHLVRANVLASGGEFDRALLEFGMAKMFGAPPKFVARYHADEGRTALAANQPGRALSELTAALAVLPDDKELVALLDRTSNAIQGDNKQQVASVPTSVPSNVPPPLNLSDGPAPKPLVAKPADPKPAPAKAPETKPAAEAPKAVTTTPGLDPMPATTETPKVDATKADAKKTETPKVEATKTDPPKVDATKVEPTPAKPVAEPKVDPAPAKPAAEPKVDPTPAPKVEPVVPPKSDAPKVPADKPAGKDAPPPAPDAPKEAPPAPDVPKADGKPVDGTPAEKKDGDVPAAKPEAQPDPDAPKDGDKPEEKKDGDPAPDAPKPEEKPAGKPDSKPADKPADEPKAGDH
jgi:hypothetical protein